MPPSLPGVGATRNALGALREANDVRLPNDTPAPSTQLPSLTAVLPAPGLNPTSQSRAPLFQRRNSTASTTLDVQKSSEVNDRIAAQPTMPRKNSAGTYSHVLALMYPESLISSRLKRPTSRTPSPGPLPSLTRSSGSPSFVPLNRGKTLGASSRHRSSLLASASDVFLGRRRRSVSHTIVEQAGDDTSDVIDIRASSMTPIEKEEERGRLREAAARLIGVSGPSHLIEEETEVEVPNSTDQVSTGIASHFSSVHSMGLGQRPTSPDPQMAEYTSYNKSPGAVALHALSSPQRTNHSYVSAIPPPSAAGARAAVAPVVSYTSVPAYPCALSSLTPFIQTSSNLLKYQPGKSFTLLHRSSRAWKPRYLVLTSLKPPPTSPSGPVPDTLSHLHLFKSPSPDEIELERLRINEDGMVFITEDGPDVVGRQFVIKIGGLDLTTKLTKGHKRQTEDERELMPTLWLVQCPDGAIMQRWISNVKNAILVQRAERAGLGMTLQARGISDMKGDIDVMLSLRTQGLSTPSPSTTNMTSYDWKTDLPSSPNQHHGSAAAENDAHLIARAKATNPGQPSLAVQALKGLFNSSGTVYANRSARPRSFSTVSRPSSPAYSLASSPGKPATSSGEGYESSLDNRAAIIFGGSARRPESPLSSGSVSHALIGQAIDATAVSTVSEEKSGLELSSSVRTGFISAPGTPLGGEFWPEESNSASLRGNSYTFPANERPAASGNIAPSLPPPPRARRPMTGQNNPLFSSATADANSVRRLATETTPPDTKEQKVVANQDPAPLSSHSPGHLLPKNTELEKNSRIASFTYPVPMSSSFGHTASVLSGGEGTPDVSDPLRYPRRASVSSARSTDSSRRSIVSDQTHPGPDYFDLARISSTSRWSRPRYNNLAIPNIASPSFGSPLPVPRSPRHDDIGKDSFPWDSSSKLDSSRSGDSGLSPSPLNSSSKRVSVGSALSVRTFNSASTSRSNSQLGRGGSGMSIRSIRSSNIPPPRPVPTTSPPAIPTSQPSSVMNPSPSPVRSVFGQRAPRRSSVLAAPPPPNSAPPLRPHEPPKPAPTSSPRAGNPSSVGKRFDSLPPLPLKAASPPITSAGKEDSQTADAGDETSASLRHVSLKTRLRMLSAPSRPNPSFRNSIAGTLPSPVASSKASPWVGERIMPRIDMNANSSPVTSPISILSAKDPDNAVANSQTLISTFSSNSPLSISPHSMVRPPTKFSPLPLGESVPQRTSLSPPPRPRSCRASRDHRTPSPASTINDLSSGNECPARRGSL
ncbi:hypothetical protein BOTBODRAFT_142412 [Botryobasidium botryosum FD-172 SS1]|uniref:PH domain-containing protein n=1 Tax=Botryobasidium botryosum (strain FD-172 SS1) TaxID=930990 RepID=A0A067NB94_BOTB1|nr:hypothetical protein BOTBODRAFT_142412 [Botryobasidium botryosum FD-172 SS1]